MLERHSKPLQTKKKRKEGTYLRAGDHYATYAFRTKAERGGDGIMNLAKWLDGLPAEPSAVRILSGR
jgi:hypothetical protein